MALTYRLYELDLLTDWGYRTIYVELSWLGYRRSEPDGIPQELGKLRLLQASRVTWSAVSSAAM